MVEREACKRCKRIFVDIDEESELIEYPHRLDDSWFRLCWSCSRELDAWLAKMPDRSENVHGWPIRYERF